MVQSLAEQLRWDALHPPGKSLHRRLWALWPVNTYRCSLSRHFLVFPTLLRTDHSAYDPKRSEFHPYLFATDLDENGRLMAHSPAGLDYLVILGGLFYAVLCSN